LTFIGANVIINLMPVLVAPSILSADFANLASEIRRAEEGKADWLHVDVMDGHFVPNLTIGSPVVKSLHKNTRLPLDVHLMITDPDRYLEDFAEAGTTYCTVHAEACTHLQRTLAQIRKLGMKAGVALNPATNPDVLQYVLNDIDLVLVMSVNPGFGGQAFIPAVVPKITVVRKMLDDAGNSNALISVDGGINVETGRTVTTAGANVLVAGKSVYGSPDVGAAIRQLHECCTTSGGRKAG
jgi:ribulose-phosphate 3-epimerase